MRIWLRAEERRPSPPPFPTNDATALLVGCGLWLAALVAVLVSSAAGAVIASEVLATVVIGLVLGSLGLYSVRGRH